jgi:hypothetical protein
MNVPNLLSVGSIACIVLGWIFAYKSDSFSLVYSILCTLIHAIVILLMMTDLCTPFTRTIIISTCCALFEFTTIIAFYVTCDNPIQSQQCTYEFGQIVYMLIIISIVICMHHYKMASIPAFNNNNQCQICYEGPTNRQLKCRHALCETCVMNLEKYECPWCRTPFKFDEIEIACIK